MRRHTPRGWVNVGLELLESGLATLHPTFAADRAREGAALLAAEAKARDGRLKIWENYVAGGDEEDDGVGASLSTNGGASTNGAAVSRATSKVTVTEVRDGTLFFTQPVEEQRVQWLAEQVARLSTADGDAVCVMVCWGGWVGRMCMIG